MSIIFPPMWFVSGVVRMSSKREVIRSHDIRLDLSESRLSHRKVYVALTFTPAATRLPKYGNASPELLAQTYFSSSAQTQRVNESPS